MTEKTKAAALGMVKARMNRIASDMTMDAYYTQRIQAAANEIENTGIRLTNSADDLMLLVDYAVYQCQNRDKTGGMPDWLRLRRRERWLKQRKMDEEAGQTEGCGCDT